ncbi:BnaC08g21690D [Brassica napus]|uniref:BnaC08g21690D protein n=1 Tax=Brassica napus TaxID=3708 RepID=A0A078FXJ9_BRANA|nr:BnaC08g21690D [Brassica napus]
MDGDSEEDSPKKTKRVPKPSRMKQSPYIEK